MKVKILDTMHGNDTSYEDLLSYLSQVVLCKIDERTREENRKLEENKKQILSCKTRIKKRKDSVSKLVSELSRQKALLRVLKMLESLKREGLWTGKNGKKLSEILETVSDRNFQQLTELSERLSIYLPG